MIPKSTQIEFGNLSRGADNPILIKAKTDENGDTILRIYQRKNLQSISSPFEKIKNVLKYTLEDFGREHKTAAKLLEKIGFGKVRVLVTKGTEQAADLIETVRSGARTGLIDEKSKTKFDNLLHDNKITNYSSFKFNVGTYSDQNFARDLKYILGKIDPEASMSLSNQFDFLNDVIDIEIFESPLEKLETLDSIIDTNEELREKIDIFFKGNNTNDQLRNEFFEKFDKILYGPMLKALGPENTKNWLLQHEEKRSEQPGNTYDQTLFNTKETAIHNINSAFSNHWWDSDEKKIKSMVDLYYRYKDSEHVPNIITTYIYFSVEALCKKNPSLREKVKELQEAHDEAAREANRIESEQEIQGMENDKV